MAVQIAELRQPGFDRNTQGGTGFDGVQPKIIAHVVEAGDVIQVIQPQVGADQGNRLILERANDGLACFIYIHIAAGDHTARHAAGADFTAACQGDFAQDSRPAAAARPQSCQR